MVGLLQAIVAGVLLLAATVALTLEFAVRSNSQVPGAKLFLWLSRAMEKLEEYNAQRERELYPSMRRVQ